MAARSDGEGPAEKTVGKAAFLGGLLAFISLASFSVVGVGHARTIVGAANTQYWVVVAITAAALAVVTLALARTPASSRTGEAARRAGVALAALWVALFLWETIGVGAGIAPGPLELLRAATV